MKASHQSASSLERRLAGSLGASINHWRLLWDELAQDFPEITAEWKSLKNAFGGYCIARHLKRALLYLIPGNAVFEVAVVIGEKAALIASTDGLLSERRRLITEAPRCAAGRTVRFKVTSPADVAAARRLVQIKTSVNK